MKCYTSNILTNIWTDISWEGIASEGGVKLKKGKKPEKLIRRIINMGTNDLKDIVLDFYSGSGTTAAVAHKMGIQYIGIEQLDYSDNDSKHRLQNVIGKKIKPKGELFEKVECDRSGISKIVNWQGGGDFIYCELMKYNEDFIDKIQAAASSEELVDLWKDIAENSFLNWYVNPEMPEEAVNDFIKIGKSENGLDKQKKLLAELLNKNQLYVNLSEIDDADFGVSKEDKKLNRSFYGECL
ncbi:MAG: DNA methyltransferase [Desulfobacterales bacterium]